MTSLSSSSPLVPVDAENQPNLSPTRPEATKSKAQRRKTLSTMPSTTASTTPAKPKQQRFSLGHASSYYFKHQSKTPLAQTLAEKQQEQLQNEQSFLDTSHLSHGDKDDATTASNFHDDDDDAVNVSMRSMHTQDFSFLSMASSTSEEADVLNQSVLSDTTELTASNFVLATSSRQRLSELLQQQPKKNNNTRDAENSARSKKEASSPLKPTTSTAKVPPKSPPTSLLLSKFADMQSSLPKLSRHQVAEKDTRMLSSRKKKAKRKSLAQLPPRRQSLFERFASPHRSSNKNTNKRLSLPLGPAAAAPLSSNNRRASLTTTNTPTTRSPGGLICAAASLKKLRLDRQEKQRLGMASVDDSVHTTENNASSILQDMMDLDETADSLLVPEQEELVVSLAQRSSTASRTMGVSPASSMSTHGRISVAPSNDYSSNTPAPLPTSISIPPMIMNSNTQEGIHKESTMHNESMDTSIQDYSTARTSAQERHQRTMTPTKFKSPAVRPKDHDGISNEMGDNLNDSIATAVSSYQERQRKCLTPTFLRSSAVRPDNDDRSAVREESNSEQVLVETTIRSATRSASSRTAQVMDQTADLEDVQDIFGSDEENTALAEETTVDSPVSTKSPAALRQMDSPARNTRSASKAAEKPVEQEEVMDQTADLKDVQDIFGSDEEETIPAEETTVNSPVSTKSPALCLMDSPARNTRSASKAADKSAQQQEAISMDQTADLNDVQDIFGSDEEETTPAEEETVNSPVSTKSPALRQMDSPVPSSARSTRSASTESPAKSIIVDSPARSTRSASQKATRSPGMSVSMVVDSPARRTRSASKKKSLESTKEPESPSGFQSPTKSVSMAMESPARSTRSASQKATRSPGMSVSMVVDSPARRTRSASKKKSLESTKEPESPSGFQSPAKSVSPARNTRSASQKATRSPGMSVSLAVDSSVLSAGSKNKGNQQADKSTTSDDTADSEDIRSVFSDLSPVEKSPTETGGQVENESFSVLHASLPLRASKSALMNIDSPVLNTGSASKKTSHEAEASAISDATADSADMRSLFSGGSPNTLGGDSLPLDESASKSINDSPAQNKKSAAKFTASVEEKTETIDRTPLPLAEESLKRKRPSSVATATTQPKSILNSRKTGTARQSGITGRRVEFGSPEVAEYNISSPSMNVTPMPAKKLRQMPSDDDTVEIETNMKYNISSPSLNMPAKKLKPMPFEDDTVEINTDMNALFKGAEPQSAFGSQALEEEDTVDLEGNMQDLFDHVTKAVASSQQLPGNIEADTVEIETDMQSLLKAVPPQDAKPQSQVESSISTSQEVETVELDVNMEELLQGGEGASKHDFHPVEEQSQPKRPRLDEDKTVEIDMDMAALLSSAPAQRDTSMMDESMESMSVSTSTVGSRRRRSSIMSRRFSLVPSGRLSVSREDLTQHSIDTIDGSENDTDKENSSESPADEPVRHQEITLTSADLVHRSSSSVEETGLTSDWLVGICGSVESTELAGVFNDLLTQVSSQVAGTTAPEIPLDAVLEVIEEVNTSNLHALQSFIADGDKESAASEIGELVEAARAVEVADWSQWQFSVAESIKEHLVQTLDTVEESIESVIENESWVDSAHRDLSSLLETKGIQRARRSVFEQRKLALAKLSEEASSIETELSESKRSFSQLAEKQQVAKTKNSQLTCRVSLDSKILQLEPDAFSLATKYTNTKGLYKWRPLTINDSELSFQFVGPSPVSCVDLSFRLSETTGVTCNAKINPQIFVLHSKEWVANRFRVVREFLASRTQALCSKVSDRSLAKVSDVGEALRDFEWHLGRLEHTASELILLRRRYRAVLTPSQIPGSSNFQMEVDFASRSQADKISATFELSESYPFAPLNVRLDTFEGHTDVDKLRRLLLKNAKPGFGYLSRTCDVIAAFLR